MSIYRGIPDSPVNGEMGTTTTAGAIEAVLCNFLVDDWTIGEIVLI
jgi:hypothetical protein